MDHVLNDLKYYGNHAPKHKMTTLKQYSLLKRKMASLVQIHQKCYKDNNSNGILRYKQDNKYWVDLTEELNNLGPPYRTMQQWKKVWCDFKRGQRKRGITNSAPKVKEHTTKEENYDNEVIEGEVHIKSELEDYEQNCPSMSTTFTNKYDNDYSYPDEDSLQESCVDEKETLIPDESSSGSYTYLNKSWPGSSVDHPSQNNYFASPPPLQRSNLPLVDQNLYSLHNEMEHQTQLLEHLSHTSVAMVSLMERQADAIEKQTEVIRRQAIATEQQTSAMNSFIDMIREKMFGGNSQKGTTATENSTNTIL